MNLADYEQVIKILLGGGVGIMSTDTLYGLVARAADAKAVARMYALKQREHKPGTVVAANAEQLTSLGLPHSDISAAEQFWPAPLSVIIKPEIDVLPHLHQGLGDFPVRIPSDPRLQSLLLQTGPLATTSANRPGDRPASTAAEARKIFGDSVDFYVDGGDLSDRQPSTIVRAAKNGVEIIREGAFKIPEEALARQ